jgi:hypothetical protein
MIWHKQKQPEPPKWIDEKAAEFNLRERNVTDDGKKWTRSRAGGRGYMTFVPCRPTSPSFSCHIFGELE